MQIVLLPTDKRVLTDGGLTIAVNPPTTAQQAAILDLTRFSTGIESRLAVIRYLLVTCSE